MESNPFYQEPVKTDPRSKFARILTVLAGLGLLLLFSWFTILGQNQVDGPSMRPNYYTGEFIILNRIPQMLGPNIASSLGIEYSRGEVIVYSKPGFPDFLKRVIALPGESVSINNGKILVNGQVLVEDYIPEKLYTNGGSLTPEGSDPIIVPSGYYFTVGDNRPESSDSRMIELGFTKREWIKGKALLRIWPLDRFLFIPKGTYTFENPENFDFSKADPSFRNHSTPQ